MSRERTNEKKVNGYASMRSMTPSKSSESVLITPPIGLSVSQQTLQFTQTASNKPSFRIVAVSQHPVGLPLTLTTDAPAYFKLAADDNPRFLTGLVLTPSTDPTYIHVQYQTAEAGQHTGKLTITNGHQTVDVALTGQQQRRSVAGVTRLPSNWQPSGRPDSMLRSKAGLLLLSLSLFAVIAYFVFSGQSVSTTQSEVRKSAVPLDVLTPKTDPIRSVKSAATSSEKARTVKAIRKPKIKKTDVAKRKESVTPPATQSEVSDQKRSPEQAAIETHRDVAKPITPTRTRSSGQAKKKASPPTPPAAESELERALNKSQ